jgi:hypothetical protein
MQRACQATQGCEYVTIVQHNDEFILHIPLRE